MLRRNEGRTLLFMTSWWLLAVAVVLAFLGGVQYHRTVFEALMSVALLVNIVTGDPRREKA